MDCTLVVETFNCLGQITWQGLIAVFLIAPLVFGMLWVMFNANKF